MVKIVLCMWLTGGVLLAPAVSKSPNSVADPRTRSKVIVIGFVGGLRNPEDPTQGVVQIRNRLRQLDCADLLVTTYSHFHWARAFDVIFQAIDLNHDGNLSDEELRKAPKVVVFGHSLGGWAVIKLARKLERSLIPVELTVQLDTVGIGDAAVPANVRFAMNYYQRTQWPIRGEKKISPKSKSSTRIIANTRLEKVGHEALARTIEVSDFIVSRVHCLCADGEVRRLW